MVDDYTTAGDVLIVPGGARLSLAVPMAVLDVWLEIDEAALSFRQVHDRLRDEVMPADAREHVVAVEAVDGVLAVEIVRRWSRALGERMGKSLLLSPSGASTEPPSPPTSGSDSDSEPQTPTSSPSRRTRKRS